MAQFNFGASSEREGETIHGSERPGSSEDLNKPGAIGMEMVEQWAKFMSEQGIKNILCLLNEEEHTFFQSPGYKQSVVQAGFEANKIHLVDVYKEGSADEIEKVLKEAKNAGEKLVVHCSGGEGRTGLVLAYWLTLDCGLDAAAACEQTVKTAAKLGVSRKPSEQKLKNFIAQRKL
ncbi:hypothetical protein GUITHDRAFT_155640 [Guillardia theta CCMP2712]|uniref:Tyrosine specific protein phosphatases domain-containing protein n=2 Tax=Guillardia theta TaxID=55529 RepID=L1IF86_GUITC|nr:hypothetical protein GUITHDRAFT_155640 [Guillardia theta CCMP2712]EKX34737.1 hypothetical protein GUITHDRAFT_155640 [Guillardia theta CCMP2712]|eukprot:XP_005821717.1 hypothetical protein GUITHDRAFT_155640 [Guillardia theta CCMP2712]